MSFTLEVTSETRKYITRLNDTASDAERQSALSEVTGFLAKNKTIRTYVVAGASAAMIADLQVMQESKTHGQRITKGEFAASHNLVGQEFSHAQCVVATLRYGAGLPAPEGKSWHEVIVGKSGGHKVTAVEAWNNLVDYRSATRTAKESVMPLASAADDYVTLTDASGDALRELLESFGSMFGMYNLCRGLGIDGKVAPKGGDDDEGDEGDEGEAPKQSVMELASKFYRRAVESGLSHTEIVDMINLLGMDV